MHPFTRKLMWLVLAAVVVVTYSHLNPALRSEDEAIPTAAGFESAGFPSVEHAMVVFQERIRRDPQDVVSYTVLGQLYMRQARETGDVAGYQRAEQTLRTALTLVPDYSPAVTALAADLYAQHNFVDAQALARTIHPDDPMYPQALMTIGDAALALGRYQTAEEAYTTVAQTSQSAPTLSRLAYLQELYGRTDEALELLQRATNASMRFGGTPENVAWYYLRLGDLSSSHGRFADAETAYQTALAVFPNYHLALAGLGKVRTAQGRYGDAIILYEHAVAIVPQPETLAALGDLYTLTGRHADAERQYRTVTFIGTLAAINRTVYNRQLAMFYANHDRELDKALELATRELADRKDIYGYDAAAWALYKRGRYTEAAQHAERALHLGTRDATLYYHAGMIYAGLGDDQKAIALLSEAMTLNPHFDPLQSRIARETLGRLTSEQRSGG